MFGPSSVRGFAPNVPRPGRAVCLAPAPLCRVRHTGRALLLIVGCTTLAACTNLSQALPQAALFDAERARSAARARLEPLSDAVDRMRSFVPVDRGLHPACAVRAGGYHAFAGTYRAATFDIVAYLFTPTVEPVGSVLVLHGYLANAGHMCGITRALLAADFVVLTPHLPGHGLSSGDRGDIDDFAQYAAVVDASVQVLSELDFGPLHAVGHSTGATALYEYLVHDPDPFERVIFAAPLVRNYGYTATRIGRTFARPFIDAIDTGYSEVIDVSRLPLSWFDALVAWNTRARRYDPLDRPILVLQGDRDRVVAWRRNRRHLRSMVTDMEFVQLHGYDHIVLSNRPGKRSGVRSVVEYLTDTLHLQS